MANIASMAVQLTAYTGKFDAAMKKSAGHVKMFGSITSSIGPKLAAFGASLAGIAAGYMSVSSITRFIGGQMEAIDATAKLADSLGLTTQELTSFQYIADLAGVSSEELANGFKFMLKNIGAGGMSTAQRFMSVADGLMQIQDAGLRAQMTMKIFGRSGMALLPMLAEGSQGMAEMSAEIERMGGLFDRAAGRQVEEANDAITRLSWLLKSVGNVLAVQLSPLIEDVAKRTLDWGTSGEGAAIKIVDAMEKAALSVFPFIDMLENAKNKADELKESMGIKTPWFETLSRAWKLSTFGSKFLVNKLLPSADETGKHKPSDSKRWSYKIRTYFDEIRKSSRAAAEESTRNIPAMTNDMGNYADMLQAAKERAQALSDAVKQTFKQGAIQTMAINTPLNRALFNQTMQLRQNEKMEVGGKLLEGILYGTNRTNQLLSDGITLKAGA